LPIQWCTRFLRLKSLTRIYTDETDFDGSQSKDDGFAVLGSLEWLLGAWRRDGPNLGFKPGMKAIAEAEGQLEDAVVGGEDEDISRGVEDGRADLAVFEVVLHLFEGLGREGAIEVAGDVVPDVFAL